MKALQITLAVVLFSFAAKAQGPRPDYMNEISVGGGVSFFTQPVRTRYTGDKEKTSYTAHINYHRYIGEDWSVGLDASMTHWENSDMQTIEGLYGASLGSVETKYLFGDRVTSVLAYANRVHWQYDEFNFQKSNFYYGVAAGMIFTSADGVMTYSYVNGQQTEANRYVSQYNFQNGIGYTFGVQAGYNHYFGNVVAFNAEIAPRFARVFTEDSKYSADNEQFYTFYLPISIGLSFRF